MTPGEFQYRGQAYHSHRGIVEASVFLVRLVRPVIWRAMDAMKKEGIDPQSDLEVIFTGHSLGGATASIAALELQVCRQSVKCKIVARSRELPAKRVRHHDERLQGAKVVLHCTLTLVGFTRTSIPLAGGQQGGRVKGTHVLWGRTGPE